MNTTLKLRPVALAVLLGSTLLGGCFHDSKNNTPVTCGDGEVLDDAGNCVADLMLHVASPEWRDQVIYFAMIDRFADGDSSNNDQGAGEYDPSQNSHYSGGDIPGITDNLDYIQTLGATALWITPPVANVWWNPRDQFAGYHGYWARDFKNVDEHYGTLDDYKTLSDALHRKSMYLIQDIVTNHVGNFFEYTGTYNPDDTSENFALIDGVLPTSAPTQYPFNMNDRNNPEHAAANIYHWTPTISDYNDNDQEFHYQSLGLDDLNTGNDVVRTALKDSFGYWIREVGVDAFRVDTAKFVEHDFWNDFIHASDGINATAAATGRDHFLTFGEVFEASDPYDDAGEVKGASFTGSTDAPELETVINFPLQYTIGQVFAEGQPTAILTDRLAKAKAIYPDWTLTPTFIDNHDTTRFLAAGTLAGFKQAYMLMMTVPGIPIIYEGDEQGFIESRRAMFGGGYASDNDAFDTDSELFQYVQNLIAVRKAHTELRRSELTVLADNATTAGVFAFSRTYGDATTFVVFNTSSTPALLNRMSTGLEAGRTFKVVAEVNNDGDWVVGDDGLLTRELPARSGVILVADDDVAATTPATTVAFTDFDGSTTVTGDLVVSGTIDDAGASVQLVLDGDLSTAITTVADSAGEWTATIPSSRFGLGTSSHQLVAYHAASGGSTDTIRFSADIEVLSVSATVSDPEDDDFGPTGSYSAPTDSSFGKQMDLVEITALAAAQQLTVSLTMNQVTDSWAPSNGFDHVAFTTFIDLPGATGLTVLPQLNASMPDGADWDIAHIAFGWNNIVYGTTGATATTRGQNLEGAPTISVAGNTITFVYDGSALGVSNWQGARIYVTTWDIDGLSGDYRPLSPEGGDYVFGGGASTDAKILDDAALLELPVTEVTVSDAEGDEAYDYPTDSSFGRQMDLLGADAVLSDDTLELTLSLKEVTDTWAPSNGFDHVSFSIFFDHPDLTGVTALPLINASMPDGRDWDVASQVFGWGNKVFTSDGASATTWGANINAAPTISVDTAAATVTLTYSASALGLADWRGVAIHVSTWDIDGLSGDYRPLAATAEGYTFGGGAATDAKEMDTLDLLLP